VQLLFAQTVGVLGDAELNPVAGAPPLYDPRPQENAERARRIGLAQLQRLLDVAYAELRIDGRDGLKELIDVVPRGAADFTTILVYDVSRWGRFQDADESAYYEYICKRAGIAVQYCAEQFENDGSPVSTIVKGVKRAMAGEYSRELSAKVFKGQCKLVERAHALRDSRGARPPMDARDGSSGGHQREVHRQQRLQSGLLQAEEEALLRADS
jgi:DNA invertase Pin-like site-specific DNA recombinase